MTEPTVDRESRLWRAIVWTLRMSVAALCVGNAAATLSFGSKVHSLLASPTDVHGLGWTDASASLVDMVAGWSLIAAAVLVLFRPCWPVLVPVVLWELALALATTWLGGDAGSEVSLLGHMARMAAPIGLMLIDPWPKNLGLSSRRVEAAIWLLRIGIAATFIGHGYESLQLKPSFVDLLLNSSRNILSWRMTQDTAECILYVIGIIDVSVGILILGFRWRTIAFYMAFWGLVTAFSRWTAVGWSGLGTIYPKLLIRTAHAGVPLAVGLYWCLAVRARRYALSDNSVAADGEPDPTEPDPPEPNPAQADPSRIEK